jgi:hypothetical protein
MDKLFIVVHAYDERALLGKYKIEKFDDVKLLKALPNVVVGNGVITGVAGIVIYGGESALTIPTNAHNDEMTPNIFFFIKPSNIIYQLLPVS